MEAKPVSELPLSEKFLSRCEQSTHSQTFIPKLSKYSQAGNYKIEKGHLLEIRSSSDYKDTKDSYSQTENPMVILKDSFSQKGSDNFKKYLSECDVIKSSIETQTNAVLLEMKSELNQSRDGLLKKPSKDIYNTPPTMTDACSQSDFPLKNAHDSSNQQGNGFIERKSSKNFMKKSLEQTFVNSHSQCDQLNNICLTSRLVQSGDGLIPRLTKSKLTKEISKEEKVDTQIQTQESRQP